MRHCLASKTLCHWGWFRDHTSLTTSACLQADFNDLCGQMLQAYTGVGTLCGHSFPLFAKGGSASTHIKLLQNVQLECHGFDELYVLSKTCVQPCISTTNGCCWIPPILSQWFPCCASLGCCPQTDSPTAAPTTASMPPSTTCVDKHPTCPELKAELDEQGMSCFTADLGEASGDASLNGKVLADQCCATCGLPTDKNCAKCMLGNSRAFCVKINVCHVNKECALPADCAMCITQSTKTELRARLCGARHCQRRRANARVLMMMVCIQAKTETSGVSYN